MAREVAFFSTGVLARIRAPLGSEKHLYGLLEVTGSAGTGYLVTSTDSSAAGGIWRVTSVVFPERIEIRFTHSEKLPFE